MIEGSHSILNREKLMLFCKSENFNAEPLSFDCADVPVDLLKVVPYAEIWGNDDEDSRRETRDKTPSVIREHLNEILNRTNLQDCLDAWLADERIVPPYTPAYLAFSCLNQTLSEID